jgi:two-component system sensor kinase FixL
MDISAKESHRAVNNNSAFLQSILNTLPDALIVIDAQGTIISFSPMAEQTFGWTAAEAIGRNVNSLMPSPYREAHDSYLQRYLETGEKHIIGKGRVVVGERKDGSTFPMELAVGEMAVSEGRFFAGLVRDLTIRQMTEARLQELQSELMHMSRLTTMGNMASALAHELNQPLSAIANYLKGTRRLIDQGEVSSERLKDAIDKAAEQALRAGDIIRRLRDFVSHGDADRRSENLTKLVEEASALALVGAREKGVHVRLEFAADVGQVMADRVEIQQVMVNLIRNAIEAMQDSPVRELRIATRARDHEWAEVAIFDTGPGLSQEAGANLFKPFTTTKKQGMGVGLSISRTIIEAHGGEIWVESNPSGGAIFRFTLPRITREAMASA